MTAAASAGTTGDPQVWYAGEREQGPQPAEPFHQWSFPDGTLWTLFYRLHEGYLLRFPGLADFEISARGDQVRAWRAPGASAAEAEHLYLNQALPLALSRQGRFVLHASAVDAGGYAVAFLGPSGRGKSTLAASFAAAGTRFLTDDGLRLEWRKDRLMALPSHASIRLWRDSREAVASAAAQVAPALAYTPKARVLADDALPHCAQALPVRALYFLGDDGLAAGPSIAPLRPAAAAAQLVRNSFLLDVEEKQMLTRHFDDLARIAGRPIHYHLDYPRSYPALTAVRHAILQHAATLPP